MSPQAAVYSQAGPCGQIASDTLTLYLSQIQCIRNGNAYSIAGTNEAECAVAAGVLLDWLYAKEQGADECPYFQSMPILQHLVTRIILSGYCK
jgi:hypothetical protein